MQYLVLIYSEEPETPEEPTPEMMAPWFEYDRALKEAGVFLGGEALLPSTTATTIRGTGEAAVITDGPFAATREALGGFYLIQCDDIDEAIRWGKQCPAAAYGAIEVRPIMSLPDE